MGMATDSADDMVSLDAMLFEMQQLIEHMLSDQAEIARLNVETRKVREQTRARLATMGIVVG